MSFLERTYEKIALILGGSMLLSTIIFSLALLNAANTVSTGLKDITFAGAPSVPTVTLTPFPTIAPSQPTVQPRANIDPAGRPVLGNADAKVTMVEFSDFQCPFCERYASNAGTQVKSNYIDTGKVKLVYMHFPLDSIHPQARPAANAAECVYRLKGADAFFKWHDLVFANQASMTDAKYAEWATESGVDATAFNDCYSKKQYDSQVTADFNQGSANGVSGTPSFFVIDRTGKSQQIVGAQPYSVFQSALDTALAA